MRIWLGLMGVFFWISFAQASERFNLSLESGEEVTVNVYPATFPEADKPLLVWFTEGYASRNSFKHLITQFNHLGYAIWQVDLLESYFIERTPNNVRGLTGEGIAAVLQYANQQSSKQNRQFVPISTGRMSLVLLRGARLWQVNSQPQNGLGALQQVVLFFPNLFDAAETAGEAPTLFPIVSATSLPITLVQPTEGTYKWKLLEVVNALQNSNSQVTLAAVPKVRDWYFLRREPTELENQAAKQLPEQLPIWIKAGRVSEQATFSPVENLTVKTATQSIKGLVSIPERLAVNFELTDVAGNAINLKDKRDKVILLNFWASWCPPCVKEIPSMNRLAESFDSDKFEIVSVNFKERPETIEAFLKSVQVDFPVLIDLDGKVSADYEIFAFPSSFLINQQGKIVYSVNTAIEWDVPEVKNIIQSMFDPEINVR